MSTMQVAVFPWDMERSLGLGDFIMTFLLISKRKGVTCTPTSTGAVIEGDETLLEILDELNDISFSKVAKKVAIKIKFDQALANSIFQVGDQFLTEESVNPDIRIGGHNVKPDKRMLHDMVVKSLGEYIKDG